jgi:HD-like signal output (HDOD) protein
MDLQSLEIRIARSENLPVLPQIVSQVMKVADDPAASAREMERCIEMDPAITAKVLRVANSSYYGLSQVPSVSRAVSVLGMNAIRSLVIGVAFQQIIAARSVANRFNKLEFWRHSLAVAICSRILGKLKCPQQSEELYVAGMMHDVGILAMDRFNPLELNKAIGFAIEERMKLHEAEQLLFGFDHSELGSLLGARWCLTPAVCRAIQYHHDPLLDPEEHLASLIVGLSDQVAHQCGLTNNVPGNPVVLDEAVIAKLDIPLEQLEIIKPIVIQEISRAEEAFGI